jgi:hypothetical protein
MTLELGIMDITTDVLKTLFLTAAHPFLDVRDIARELPEENDVPDFADEFKLRDWLLRYNLAANFSRGHMDMALCGPVLRAYMRFAKLYPEMALYNHVGTWNGESALFWVPNKLTNGATAGGIGFSASTFVPNTGIFLNEVYFSDAKKFYSLYDGWERARWFPTVYGHGVEAIVIHELSHQMHSSLNKEEKAGWESFIVEHDADRRALSGYAMSMPRECFCEAMSAYMYGDYGDNPVVSRAAELARRFEA